MVRQESTGLHTYNIHFLSTIRSLQYTGYSYSLSCRMDLWNTMPPCSSFSFPNLHPSAVCQTSGSFTRPVMLESWWRPVMLPVTTKETCSKSRKRKGMFVPESFWSYLNSHLLYSFLFVWSSNPYSRGSHLISQTKSILIMDILIWLISVYVLLYWLSLHTTSITWYIPVSRCFECYISIWNRAPCAIGPSTQPAQFQRGAAASGWYEWPCGRLDWKTDARAECWWNDQQGSMLTLGATVPSLKEKALSSHYAAP